MLLERPEVNPSSENQETLTHDKMFLRGRRSRSGELGLMMDDVMLQEETLMVVVKMKLRAKVKVLR